MASRAECPRCGKASVTPGALMSPWHVIVVGLLALLVVGMHFDAPRSQLYSFVIGVVTLFVLLRTSQGVCSSCGARLKQTIRGTWT